MLIYTYSGTGPTVISHNLFVLCQDTVVKAGIDYYLAPGARPLDFVWANTSVAVLKVRRYIISWIYADLLLEKIEGTRLDKLWPPYSPSQIFLTASYILELRKASCIYHCCYFPGLMGNGPQQFHGPAFLFGDRYKDPFDHPMQLPGYISGWPRNSGHRFDNSYEGRDGKL
jgi:hypothetical protein